MLLNLSYSSLKILSISNKADYIVYKLFYSTFHSFYLQFFDLLLFLMLSIRGSTMHTKIMSTKKHLYLTFLIILNSLNMLSISTTNLMSSTVTIILLTKLSKNLIFFITFLIYLLSTLLYAFLKSISTTILSISLFFLHTISTSITLI